MAERSKAPDSRLDTLHCCNDIPRAFWSPLGGVGSNPTPTESFCEKLRFIQINDRKEELLSMDFGVIRSHASCIGHKRKQAMDNIIMNCQRNDSKMQNSQIVQPSFHILRGIFFQQRR